MRHRISRSGSPAAPDRVGAEPFGDADYPAAPYPGRVPACSFVHLDAVGWPLRPDPSAPSGWRVGPGDADVDAWLTGRGGARLAERVPVLTYGSNRCPSKISWLRRELGLTGPVVVLAAVLTGAAAAWAAGLRRRDDQRPAVLVAAPGVAEPHAVWLATSDQVKVLDRCEGRGERYRLARLRSGTLRTEDGVRVERPWCYLGNAAGRMPLLVDGAPVRCAETPQPAARELAGAAGRGDGLVADAVTGAPHPDEWPEWLFGYGHLRPGRRGWPLVAPHLAGPPRAARAHGTRFDTGLGYPAMLPGPRPDVPGTLLPVRDPRTLLASVDRYEGARYRRVRLVVLPDGGEPTIAWAYLWAGDRSTLRPSAR
jgi:gamma-glutamylcyclotransferase (GGCT)/AIG2-like uncharacterized protein YtfP